MKTFLWFVAALTLFLRPAWAAEDTAIMRHTDPVSSSTKTYLDGVIEDVKTNKEQWFVDIRIDSGEVRRLICDDPECDPTTLSRFGKSRIHVIYTAIQSGLYDDDISWKVVSIAKH